MYKNIRRKNIKHFLFDITEGLNYHVVIHKEVNYDQQDDIFITNFIDNNIIPLYKSCVVEGSVLGEWEFKQLQERGVLTYTEFETLRQLCK
tara:strand:- start:350 stop:622 length:273 start_codon:yes stop_codon:yes gene_type:complete